MRTNVPAVFFALSMSMSSHTPSVEEIALRLTQRCAPLVAVRSVVGGAGIARVFTPDPATSQAIVRATGLSKLVQVVSVPKVAPLTRPSGGSPPSDSEAPAGSYSKKNNRLTLGGLGPFSQQLAVDLEQWGGDQWTRIGSTVSPTVTGAQRCPTTWWYSLPTDLVLAANESEIGVGRYRLVLPKLPSGFYRVRAIRIVQGITTAATVHQFTVNH